MDQQIKNQPLSKKQNSLWSILHDVGLCAYIPAILSLVVLVVVIILKEWFSVLPFLAMAVISTMIAYGLTKFTPNDKELGERSLNIMVVLCSWILVVILGSIPFYGMAYNFELTESSVLIFRDFSNCFFESMSGFTSTGLSVVPDASKLPASLQFWRSLMEWVGGVGVVLLALLIIKPAEDKKKLYRAEARNKIFNNSIRQTIKWIWIIYITYTLLAIVLFRIVGMNFWEAINHGMTAISTGGFTVTRDSFQNYSSQIKMASIFIVIFGALSFYGHYLFWIKKDITRLLKQSEIKMFFGYWFLGIFLLSLIVLYSSQNVIWQDCLFQWTSALGTCGFSSINIKSSHGALIQLLILGMFIGGCSGSTAGGVKIYRFNWAIKSLVWRIKSVWKKEQRNISFYYDEKQISQQKGLLKVESALSLMFIWIGVIFICSFFLILILNDKYPPSHIFFETTSALGGVGLSTGVISAMLPASAKYLFSLLMWMGRLEIISVLILLGLPNVYFLGRKKQVANNENKITKQEIKRDK